MKTEGENTMAIPAFLQEMLEKQYGAAWTARIYEGFAAARRTTLRVNTLKSDAETVRAALEAAGIACEAAPWSENALILPHGSEAQVEALDIYAQGCIYMQSLSSIVPPIALTPQADECILDMAAAPGGKTTQMAALTANRAQITACEKNKIRADRLRYNLEKQGAKGVVVMQTDSRQLDDFFAFDRVLLDAPCSGSGTLSTQGCCAFNKELLDRSVKTQEKLLRKALALLKPGHEMVYSTCSILAQENEDLLARVLPCAQGEIVPLQGGAFEGMPLLPVKMPGTLCICPDETYEGFFVAKIRRRAQKKK